MLQRNGSKAQWGPVLRILDDVMAFERTQLAQIALGGEFPSSLPDLSEQGVIDRSAKAAELLARLNEIDDDQLPHDAALSVRLARHTLSHKAKAADWYWLVFDPLGVGFYAMFAPTSYGAGFLLNQISGRVGQLPLQTRSQGYEYLSLLDQTVRLAEQLIERTHGQMKRGIYMPRAQYDRALIFLKGIKAGLVSAFGSGAERYEGESPETFQAILDQSIARDLSGVFDDFIELLGPEYADQVKDSVGLAQFEGGAKVYEELVRFHLTLEMTPEQVHEAGHQRMRQVKAEMDAIRKQAGFNGSNQEFLESLNTNPNWRAETAEDITEVFQRYIDRLSPHLPDYFDFEAPYPCAAGPLPAELEPSMTFGFYRSPSAADPKGTYLFNTANLSNNNLSGIASLNYHELIPGHHLHMTTQKANDQIHPLHNYAFVNAYNEGWAEYAAELAGEIGMYSDPVERFGRLVNDAFLTTRLIVDTGMNALGWTLEQARDYMRENAFMPETEILSESVRYSCDIPGQALAYKLGDTEMFKMRDAMREQLGEAFDIKDFHRAVIHPGALPLPDLKWHIERTTEQILARL